MPVCAGWWADSVTNSQGVSEHRPETIKMIGYALIHHPVSTTAIAPGNAEADT